MQRRVFSIVLFAAVLTTTISACGHNTSAPSNVKQSARHSGNVPKNVKTSPYNAADNTKVSPPNITAGAKLYASTCQSCHGKNGAGTSQGPKLAASPTVVSRFGSETALEAFVAHNMPATDPGSLTPQQATNVSGYVWGLAKK